MNDQISDDALLRELGHRLARHRLNRNMTQAALAHEAGVSRSTVARLESGESTQLTNLLRILRGLDLLGQLDALIPPPGLSPVQQLALQGKTRQRASGQPLPAEDEPWSWGEEPGDESG